MLECVQAYDAMDGELPLGTKLIQGNDSVAPRAATRLEDGRYAVTDFVAPGVVHIATGHTSQPPRIGQPIFETPMIATGLRAAGAPVSQVHVHRTDSPPTAQSAEMGVRMRPTDLGVEVVDGAGKRVVRVNPSDVSSPWKTIEIENDAAHAYGFGEFPRGTNTDAPWLGWYVRTDSEHGNIMQPFFGGVSSYTQFPVAYGLRDDGTAFAVVVDTPHKVEWDLTDPGKWKIHTGGDEVRMFVLTGKNLPEVRKKYMELTGKPPVPPSSLFGAGVSKFGYRSWAEVDQDIAEANREGVPVNLVGLDLQWFGGDFVANPHGGNQFTRMGSLTPDESNFPEFAKKVAALHDKGTDVMLISESYVNLNLPEARQLRELGCLVKDENGEPIVFENKWWGTGYMIDWTHPKSAEWIRMKYVPLAKAGVRHFWLDLGEPEAGLYAPNGRYHGIEPGKIAHHEVHNIYNTMWAKRFHEVMAEEMPGQRFYTMNRSGGPGMQRFGAGKWGGDVGVSVQNFPNGQHLPGDVPELIAHFQNRIMNLPMTGVDYYSSDVGGFHRWALGGDQELRDKTYTVWYANSALLDTPFRPHLWIKSGEDRYLPTHTGHVPSNVANARLRGELEPFYYQAAHRASTEGEPVVAPLVYHYGSDRNVRQMGHEAILGRDLLMGVVGNVRETNRSIYLPEGGWYDYHTGQYHAGSGAGRWLHNVDLNRNGVFQVPLYAREGAIVPLNRVDSQGARIDANKEFRVRVFAGEESTKSRIVEDDGMSAPSAANQRSTQVSQKKTQKGFTVTVDGAQGTFFGASARRSQRVEIVLPQGKVSRAFINGTEAEVAKSEAELYGDKAKVYIDSSRNIAILYSPTQPVVVSTRYEFQVTP